MLMNANDVPNLSPLTRVEGRREKEGEEVVVEGGTHAYVFNSLLLRPAPPDS